MTSVTIDQKTPLLSPYEKIYQADTDTSITLSPPNGHTWSKVILPADYTTNQLPDFNQENGISNGSPWSRSDEAKYGVGYTSINSGTSVVLHQKDNWNNSSTAFNPGDTYDWTLDTTNHKYSYEFHLDNQLAKTAATVISACDATTNWTVNTGTGTLAIDTSDKQEGTGSLWTNGTGITSASGIIQYRYTASISLTSKEFLEIYVKSNIAGDLLLRITDNAAAYKEDTGSRFPIAANTWTRFVLPILAPQGTTGRLPSTVSGTIALATIATIDVGIDTTSNSLPIELHVDDLCSDVGQWVAVETNVPDLILPSVAGLNLYSWN